VLFTAIFAIQGTEGKKRIAQEINVEAYMPYMAMILNHGRQIGG
jgi:hypothetical protein